MSKKFQLYALNPRLHNVNECKVEDILHIRAGTEFKFKSGPFNGQIATILKEPTTQISSSDHLVEIILNNKLDSKLIIPLHQYSIEYLKFASQIFSPEIMIPNHDVFKVEYSNIREVNNQIIYEISKNNKYLDFLHPSAFEDLVGKL
ncbi:MAG: hypothetical protein Q8K02_16665 [Flavobacterium sp.]|nr:hypothetical protein [Flavobacterium sp.]